MANVALHHGTADFFRHNKVTTEITKEIKSFSILVLTPPPLDYKRQDCLYKSIRPFVRDEFKDITCPRPTYTDNE